MRFPCFARCVPVLTLVLTSAACGTAAVTPDQAATSPATVFAIDRDALTAAMAGRPVEDMRYTPGQIVLSSELASRTLLVGAINTVSDPANVVGSVVHTFPTAGGTCARPAEIDISSVSPTTVLKDDVKLGAKAVATVWYNEIIEKQQNAELGYLAFSLQMQKNDRAEVLLQDVAIVDVEHFDVQRDPAKLAAAESRPLPPGACGRYVITRLAVTVQSHRIYRRREQGGTVNALLRIGATAYYSHTKLQNDLLVAVQLQPIGYQETGGATRASTQPPVRLEIRAE